MLNRVATTNITLREINHLDRHLDRSRQVDPKQLMSLYGKLDITPYQGPIYRGLGVKNEDVEMLFINDAFKAEDYSFDFKVQSWTTSPRVAEYFAKESLKEDYPGGGEVMGIVIQSNTNVYNPIFHLDKEVFEELRYIIDELEFDESMTESIRAYVSEREVMIANPGSVTYTFCEDVIGVLLSYPQLQKYTQDYPQPLEILKEHMESDSWVELERAFENGITDLGVYECSGGGMLKFKYYGVPDPEDVA